MGTVWSAAQETKDVSRVLPPWRCAVAEAVVGGDKSIAWMVCVVRAIGICRAVATNNYRTDSGGE